MIKRQKKILDGDRGPRFPSDLLDFHKPKEEGVEVSKDSILFHEASDRLGIFLVLPFLILHICPYLLLFIPDFSSV